MTFYEELTCLLNRHSCEQASDTPDYVVAQYLSACLTAYTVAIQAVVRAALGVGAVANNSSKDHTYSADMILATLRNLYLTEDSPDKWKRFETLLGIPHTSSEGREDEYAL